MFEYESDNTKIKKYLDKLEQIILLAYGKPCKKKATGCVVCRAWIAFENLKINLY